MSFEQGRHHNPFCFPGRSYHSLLSLADTYTDLQLLNPSGGSDAGQPYALSEKNIAWSGEAKHYTNSPPGQPSDYLPPPNWSDRYPDGYTEFPALADDEHFQVWMRTSALPTFSKLWARNDDDVMQSGTYEMTINMSECVRVDGWTADQRADFICSKPLLDYPVRQFGGTKSIVFSTVSWMGGKNPFLGWAYIAAAALFVLLAIAGTAKHLLRPRRMGDMSSESSEAVGRCLCCYSRALRFACLTVLSWNQPK